MARYTNAIVFEGLEDLGEEMNKKLKIYGVDKVSVTMDEITIVGKGHPELWKQVELETGESIDDFEGIDDESKKIGHTFPMTKVAKMFETAFGYSGSLKQLDEEIYYLRSDSKAEDLQEMITEALESSTALIDINDDKEIIVESAFDILIQIANIIGNQTMEDELASTKLNMM